MSIDQLADRVSLITVKFNANEESKFYRTFMLGIFVGVLALCQFSILMEILMKERKKTSTLQTVTRSNGGRRITKNEEDSDDEGSNDEDGDGDCLCSKH